MTFFFFFRSLSVQISPFHYYAVWLKLPSSPWPRLGSNPGRPLDFHLGSLFALPGNKLKQALVLTSRFSLCHGSFPCTVWCPMSENWWYIYIFFLFLNFLVAIIFYYSILNNSRWFLKIILKDYYLTKVILETFF